MRTGAREKGRPAWAALQRIMYCDTSKPTTPARPPCRASSRHAPARGSAGAERAAVDEVAGHPQRGGPAGGRVAEEADHLLGDLGAVHVVPAARDLAGPRDAHRRQRHARRQRRRGGVEAGRRAGGLGVAGERARGPSAPSRPSRRRPPSRRTAAAAGRRRRARTCRPSRPGASRAAVCRSDCVSALPPAGSTAANLRCPASIRSRPIRAAPSAASTSTACIEYIRASRPTATTVMFRTTRSRRNDSGVALAASITALNALRKLGRIRVASQVDCVSGFARRRCSSRICASASSSSHSSSHRPPPFDGGARALDVRPAADAAVQHALGGEVGQRLAERLGVDVEPLGQRPLAGQLARQLARRDGRAQLLAQPLELVAHLGGATLGARGRRLRWCSGDSMPDLDVRTETTDGIRRHIHNSGRVPFLPQRPRDRPDDATLRVTRTIFGGKGGSPSRFIYLCHTPRCKYFARLSLPSQSAAARNRRLRL